MGQTDVAEIEQHISGLEQRVLARVGKWSLAILAGFASLLLSIAALYYGLDGRIGRLETWKTERSVPIEDYYKHREMLEGRLSTLEAQSKEIAEGQREIIQLLRQR